MRIALILPVLCLFSCSTLRNPRTGESLGEKGGGLLGSVVGDAAGNEKVGAIIGSSLGGATGAGLLKTIENQKRDLAQKLPMASVLLTGDTIRIILNNKFVFSGARPTLKKDVAQLLDPLAANLQQFGDSKILVAGFTDSRGALKQNQHISTLRSQSVSSYLKSKGIAAERLHAVGLGEARPLEPNTTEAGRAANRRMEFLITH